MFGIDLRAEYSIDCCMQQKRRGGIPAKDERRYPKHRKQAHTYEYQGGEESEMNQPIPSAESAFSEPKRDRLFGSRLR